MQFCRKMSNFTLKWDNAPADYGSLLDGSEVISAFDFAVGTLPLSVVVRLQASYRYAAK